MTNRFFLSVCLLLSVVISYAQKSTPVKFAFFADTHIAIDSPRIADLEKCINDINSQSDIQFAIFAGDVTEFGADDEIRLAKRVIDKLSIPYYVVAGNHDAKWSESGCNTFAKVFGYENFEFEAGGIRFMGSNSGPNMRMAPALLPHESVVWIDSIARVIPKDQPVIFVNHYPQDTSMLNYFQVVDALKQTNIQLIMGGHWHNNVKLEYLGVPGMLGRSPDARKGVGVGYNIITIENGELRAQERIAADANGKGGELRKAWYTLKFSKTPQFTPTEKTKENPYGLPEGFPWITFSVNDEFPQIKSVWRTQDNSDIGSGATPAGKYVVYTNTQGVIKALDLKTGEQKWEFATSGKVFSTPAVEGNRVVVGSTDGYIYCLKLKNGKILWKYKCEKSVLAAPTVYKGVAYIGASDGVFRAIKVKSGKILWQFDGVRGFVESKPYVDAEQVVFGDWGNTLYSLDTKSGDLQWSWSCKGSRMLSPAAVYPVKSNGNIFFVTPARKTFCLDAKSGKELWSANGGRESIALSYDGSKIYVKNMFNSLQSYAADGSECKKVWDVKTTLGYDIAPTPSLSVVKDGEELIIVPTDKGNIFCFNALDGSLLWKHKISVALINSIIPIANNRIVVSTMDGVVTVLEY